MVLSGGRETDIAVVARLGRWGRGSQPRGGRRLGGAADWTLPLRVNFPSQSTFKCPVCDVNYTTLASLKRHVKTKHEGYFMSESFVYDECAEEFETVKQVKAHQTSTHGAMAPPSAPDGAFPCLYCPLHFFTKVSLGQLTSKRLTHGTSVAGASGSCHVAANILVPVPSRQPSVDAQLRFSSPSPHVNVSSPNVVQFSSPSPHVNVSSPNADLQPQYTSTSPRLNLEPDPLSMPSAIPIAPVMSPSSQLNAVDIDAIFAPQRTLSDVDGTIVPLSCPCPPQHALSVTAQPFVPAPPNTYSPSAIANADPVVDDVNATLRAPFYSAVTAWKLAPHSTAPHSTLIITKQYCAAGASDPQVQELTIITQ
ncbi:hypothetical protein EMCRGX_G005375 [Ephydatia muelleri]